MLLPAFCIGSLPSNQNYSILLCPEPSKCSPHPPVLLKINFNIILPSIHRFSHWLIPSGFPIEAHISFLSLACHLPHPSLILFCHSNHICRGIELLIIYFLIGFVGCGVQLGPLGTAATNVLLCQPRVI
jgi:hypothetical protein